MSVSSLRWSWERPDVQPVSGGRFNVNLPCNRLSNDEVRASPSATCGKSATNLERAIRWESAKKDGASEVGRTLKKPPVEREPFRNRNPNRLRPRRLVQETTSISLLLVFDGRVKQENAAMIIPNKIDRWTSRRVRPKGGLSRAAVPALHPNGAGTHAPVKSSPGSSRTRQRAAKLTGLAEHTLQSAQGQSEISTRAL